MMKRTPQGATTAIAAALALVLLPAGSGTAHAQTPPRAAGASIVQIGADGSIKAPSEVRAGISHLTVTGSPGEALQLVEPRHSESVATLVTDYGQFADTGLPAGTEHDFRFIGGSFTGSDLYLDLAPGTYYAFDAGQSALSAAHVVTLHARGPVQRRINLPRITGSVSAVGTDRWSDRPAEIGRSGHLLFTNAATETHLVNLLQLKPGTTLAEVKATLADPDGDPSGLSTGVYAELGVLSPGGRELVSYSLPAGAYAVLDLWPDDTTGQSHSALGMVRLIHVG